MSSISDESAKSHVRACLELAERARGQASPNPLVGAVLVGADGVIGRGYHRRCGEPHAERLALDEAGTAARGATLYTNMEPCCHQGRTPPCTEAIIAAGVARVVACLRDPDPRVDGNGFAALRAAGIDVSTGLLAGAAARLHGGYLRFKSAGVPQVTAKAALSLDGRLATTARQSQWITGVEARALGHRLRAGVDAVAVGVETLLADDPRLTARRAEGNGPRYRVVLDSHLRSPVDARILQETSGEALFICTDAAPEAARRKLEAAGGRVIVAAAGPDGRVSLEGALRGVADLGVLDLLIEGGATLLTAAFDAGIIDKLVLFYAPLLIGGRDAPALWAGVGTERLAAAPRLSRVRLHRLGQDWAVEGYLREPGSPVG